MIRLKIILRATYEMKFHSLQIYELTGGILKHFQISVNIINENSGICTLPEMGVHRGIIQAETGHRKSHRRQAEMSKCTLDS